MTTISPRVSLRYASEEDISEIVQVMAEVSEGVIETLFGQISLGITSNKALELIFRQGAKPYDLNNVVILTVDQKIAGLFLGYDSKFQAITPLMRAFLPEHVLDDLSELLLATVADAYWVNTFWVSPIYRGQGASAMLMRYVFHLAQESGLKKVALHCWANNLRALKFYQKHGFVHYQDITVWGSLKDRHPLGGKILVKSF